MTTTFSEGSACNERVAELAVVQQLVVSALPAPGGTTWMRLVGSVRRVTSGASHAQVLQRRTEFQNNVETTVAGMKPQQHASSAQMGALDATPTKTVLDAQIDGTLRQMAVVSQSARDVFQTVRNVQMTLPVRHVEISTTTTILVLHVKTVTHAVISVQTLVLTTVRHVRPRFTGRAMA
ncbi:MAG: hypothetical protein V2I33_25825, partial [Kangiellaceae bacterium]|nr:hypothetical protein [Kangiellaceae bacterium]